MGPGCQGDGAGRGRGGWPRPCLTFLEAVQVLRVVGAIVPAGDAQDLQVKAWGQRHGLLRTRREDL